MAAHSEQGPTEGVETGDINYTAVVSFVVVLTMAVLAAVLVVNYLFQFLVHLEEDRKIVDDPQVTERHLLFDNAEIEALKDRYLPPEKRDYKIEKQINDADWQEYKVARDRVLVQGIHRAKLPAAPTLESADVLDPLHSGAVRDAMTLGHENIKAGNRILNPDENDKSATEKLKVEKKLTIPVTFKAILDKGLIKTAGK